MKKILIVIFALVFAGCNENVENNTKPGATAAEVANKQLQQQLSEQAEAHASEVETLRLENEALAQSTGGQIVALTSKIDELNTRLIEPLARAQDRANAAEEIAVAAQATVAAIGPELETTKSALASALAASASGKSSLATATILGWSAASFAVIASGLVFLFYRKRKEDVEDYEQLSKEHSVEVEMLKSKIEASDAELLKAVETARDVAKLNAQQVQNNNGKTRQPKKWKPEDKKPQQQKPQQQKQHKAGDTFTNKQLVQAPASMLSNAEAKADPNIGAALLNAVNEDLEAKGEQPITYNKNPDDAASPAQLQDLKQNFGAGNASQ
jgi:hypothetical protein